MDILINNVLYDQINLYSNITVDFQNRRVNDEIRGYIYFYNNSWTFVYSKPNHVNIKKVAIILESPHKDEFDIYYNPLHPANGKTGLKIYKNIIHQLSKTINLSNQYCYEIFIMNPVPYQCSLYHELEVNNFGSNIYGLFSHNRKLTNKVFSALFFGKKLNKGYKNLKDDFIDRVNKYNPDYIINCCTYSKRKVVANAILKTTYKKEIYTLNHPSMW